MLRNELPGLQTIPGKLAAIGERGLGAISFAPVLGSGADQNQTMSNLPALARNADALRASPVPLTAEHVDTALARGGSTLGGAFPKISAHLPLGSEFLDRQEILVGGPTPAGHSPCILKFARTSDEAEGAVEFAFWLMARNAGIRLPRACLVNDGERRHFAVERFDRYRQLDGSMAKRHVHSLSGMLHRRASDGAIDYEDFMRLSRRLGGAGEAVECLRRAIFNLLATNRDDHGRNHCFLYDETTRTWTLAPAFDLNPSVYNTLIALNWLGSNQVPRQFAAVTRLAEIGGISAKVAREIYQKVEVAVIGGWSAATATAGVPVPLIDYWQREMTQQTQALRQDARSQAAPKKRGLRAKRPTET